jgi:TorA maturation chaperone TorD
MRSEPLHFARALPPEEQARANYYGLLARLFYSAPDAELLRLIAEAGDMEAEDDRLATAWRELQAAARSADPERVREEYEAAFVGTGKAPVTLYSGAYSVRFTNEVPLAGLRGELASLGLARRVDAGEPEDHVAALFDTLRHLIAEQQRDLAEQRRFFERWIGPVVDPLCAAIEKTEATDFYRRVGRLARAFLTLEQAAFEML